MKRISFLLALGFLLIPAIASALDYKIWLPLIPETLDNMPRKNDPEGMNMEMSGQKWASLCQEYSEGKKLLNFCIFAGMAPQAMQYQSLFAMNMSMETPEQVIKTITISGNKVLLVLEKKEGNGTAVIDLDNNLIAVLNVEYRITEGEISKLVEVLPLAELKNMAK